MSFRQPFLLSTGLLIVGNLLYGMVSVLSIKRQNTYYLEYILPRHLVCISRYGYDWLLILTCTFITIISFDWLLCTML